MEVGFTTLFLGLNAHCGRIARLLRKMSWDEINGLFVADEYNLSFPTIFDFV